MATSFRKVVWVLAFILLGATAGATIMGQATTGSISGVISDESKAVLPGVTVTVTNLGTNISRTAVTDDGGRYQILNLGLGTYQVKAELAGFKAGVRSGIELTIGREALVDMTLSVGELTEEVRVVGDAPLVETSSPTLGGLVGRDQIQDLPLNGRSYQDLVALQLGAALPTKTTDDPSQGLGKKFAVSGARFSFNQFMVDGGEINDSRDSTPASVAGTTLGVEAVREFKVMTNNYSAEYGRSAGAVISVATKSGTNRFHGSVYEYLRNSAMDAKNFFTVGKTLPFKRNQFGAEVDGPIVKDHTFFMVNYEGLRQRLSTPATFFTLDANARLGILPGSPQITVNPLIRPYLNLYPLPTPGGTNFRNGTAEFITESKSPIDEDYFTVRIDHQFSQLNSLFGRYTYDRGENDITNTAFDLFGLTRLTSAKNLVLEEKWVVSSTLINSVMFGYNRPVGNQDSSKLKTISPGSTIEGLTNFGSVSVPGLSGLSQSALDNHDLHLYSLLDNVIHVRGRHSLKFGGDLKRFFNHNSSIFQDGGSWTFPSVQTLLTDSPTRLEAVAPGFSRDQDVRQNLAGFYVQDDMNVRPGLTVNAGLRYEFITVPYERNGKQANMKSLYDSQLYVGQKPFFENPSLKNFAPRLGFGWDVFGDGKTALRGGFGVFHAQLLGRSYERTFRRMPPFFNTAILSPPPPLPLTSQAYAGLRTQPLNTVQVQPIDFHPSTPYMMQYNLTVQRELLPNTVLTASYVGSRGVHLVRKINWNIPIPQIVDGRPFFPPVIVRRNPNFSSIQVAQTDANSVYNSLQVGLNRRLSQGLRFQANYTFSRSIDTGSDVTENSFKASVHRPQTPDDRNDMRGLSDFHVQHSFAVNTSYVLPWGSGLTGMAGKLAYGWEVSNIVSVATGSPIGIELGFDRIRTGETNGQRPNLRAGYSNNPVLGGPNQYYDINAYELQPAGFLGNSGRHTLIGPGQATVDLSLHKNFRVREISEDFRVQFRAEFFNILNHPNFFVPNPGGTGGARPLNAAGNRLPTAARITQTSSTSRQIQLALKILF